MLNILLIDDDKDIGSLITRYLEKKISCKVTYLEKTEQAYNLLTQGNFDCVILDYLMPEEDGFTFLKNIREQGILTPVIMLSAYNDVEKRIEGLTIGADDYLGKPFEPEELVLRIHSLHKRTVKKTPKSEIIKYNEKIFYNTKLRTLEVNGLSTEFSESAHSVFKVLFANHDNEVSKKELIEDLDKEYSIETINTLNVTIMRLREHLKKNIGDAMVIKTIRNKGYILIIQS